MWDATPLAEDVTKMAKLFAIYEKIEHNLVEEKVEASAFWRDLSSGPSTLSCVWKRSNGGVTSIGGGHTSHAQSCKAKHRSGEIPCILPCYLGELNLGAVPTKCAITTGIEGWSTRLLE